MIHARLIIHPTDSVRIQEIQTYIASIRVVDTDTSTLEAQDDKEFIGISQVKEFTRMMSLAPNRSPYRVGSIPNAQTLTTEAQNALLKLIEEPPIHALCILGAPSVDAVLPTIVSRCQVQIVQIDASAVVHNAENIHEQLKTLLHGSPQAIISIIQEVATDRVIAKQWTNAALVELRSLLLSEISTGPSSTKATRIIHCIRSLEKTRKELAVNVTPRLALENAFF